MAAPRSRTGSRTFDVRRQRPAGVKHDLTAKLRAAGTGELAANSGDGRIGGGDKDCASREDRRGNERGRTTRSDKADGAASAGFALRDDRFNFPTELVKSARKNAAGPACSDDRNGARHAVC